MYSYGEMQILELPSLANLNGTPATVSEWSYRHDIDSGESFHLWVRTILVFRPGRSHTYHLVDSLKRRHISPGTWQRLQNSIHYGPPVVQA
jgi:hypothetical protein